MADDIILTATGDADSLRSEMEEAARSVESSMERAGDAVERLDLESKAGEAEALGDAFETAGEKSAATLDDLVAALAELDAAEAKTAAEGLEELADAAERSGEAIEGAGDRGAAAMGDLSDRTRAAADAGLEAGQRIARAWESLEENARGAAAGVNLADQAFEALGGSPAEFLSAANSEAERQVILLADLAKNVHQLDEESREGLSGFADRAAKATQRISELEDSLERQGDQALPQLRQELDRLRKQYKETFETGARRAANLEAEIEKNEDALHRMRLEARGAAGGLTDVSEAIRLKFPGAAKTIGGVVASVAAFKTAFQETREVIDFFEKNFGIRIDSITRRFLALDKIAQGFTGTGNELEDQFFRLGNSVKALEGAGVPIGDLGERYQELAERIRQATDEAPVYVGRHRELTDQLRIEGDEADQLASLITRADEAMRKLGETNLDTADKLHRSIDALRALQERALELKIDDVAKGFRDLSDAARALEERRDELRDGPVFEQWAEEATELREQLSELPPALQEVFEEASGTSSQEAVETLDEIAKSLGVVILSTKEAEEAAKKLAESQRQAAKQMLDAWGQVADQLRQVANIDPTSPDLGGPTIDLDGPRRELEALEQQLDDIRRKPILSIDEVNLETELVGQIQRARQELSQLEARVPVHIETEQARQDLAAVFRDALASSGFEEAFAGLGAETRRQVALLIAQLDELVATTNVLDPQILEDFARAIRQALGQEGSAAAASLESALGRLGASSGDVVQRLLQVAAQGESTATSLGQLQTAVTATETAAGEGVIKLSQTGEVVAEIGTRAEETSSKASQLGETLTATGTAAEGARIQVVGAGEQISVLSQETEAAGQAAEGARIRIEGAGDSVSVVKTEAEEAANSLEGMKESLEGSDTAAESLGQVATAAEAAGPAVQDLATSAQALGTGFEMITTHTPGEALSQLTARAQETTEPLTQLAEAATAAATPIGQLADASERIAAAAETPKRLAEIATASETAEPPVTVLAKSAAKLEQSVSGLVAKGGELPELLEQWVTAAEGLPAVLDPLTDDTLQRHREQLDQVAEGYRSATEQQTALTTGAGELVLSFDDLRAKSDEITQSLDAGSESIDRYQSSLEGLKETIDTIRDAAEGLGDSISSMVSEETVGRAQNLLGILEQMIATTDRLALGFDKADAALDGMLQ